MASLSPAAAPTALRPGDSVVLTAGTGTREGTVVSVEPHGVIRFQDAATGRTRLADTAHWDTVQVPALSPEAS